MIARNLRKFRLNQDHTQTSTRRSSSGHVETEFEDTAGFHPKIKLGQSWIMNDYPDKNLKPSKPLTLFGLNVSVFVI